MKRQRIDQCFTLAQKLEAASSPQAKKPRLEQEIISRLMRSAEEYENEHDIKWSESQWNIIKQVDMKKNIFFTGNAGTGKSTLLNFFKQALPKYTTFITAATGLAACHIGGTTVHSFVGAGLAKGDIQQCVKMIRRRRDRVKRWKKARILIVDEVSMISGEFFDKMNLIGQAIRGNEEPFGGVQVILTGDFLQLPPITYKREGYAFQAKTWRHCIDVICRLSTIFRQNDSKFVDLLNEVRLGDISDENVGILESRMNQPKPEEGVVETKLFSRKNDVQRYNNHHLQELDKDTEHRYTAEDWVENKSLESLLNAGQAQEVVSLRVGAHVMLIWNLDLDAGLCNGAQGIVTEFREGTDGEMYPYVHFQNDEKRIIEPLEWKIEREGKKVAARKQIPLMLAWAVTIHKSQGMTLDHASIALGTVFENGQAYVALSRVRSLEGLRLTSFHPDRVMANADAIKFDEQLKQ